MSRVARLSDAPLPVLGGAVLPPWPGELRDGLFVRTAPAPAGAEPALFVHGLGGSSTNWTDLMALLGQRLAGEAVDLPGFGCSDPPAAGSYRTDAHADAVVGLIERRAAGPVHLFGNSLGGAVATLVAARRPELVRTLTLVSPALPSLSPRRGGDARLPLLLVPGLSRLAQQQIQRRTPGQRARDVIDACFADPGRVPAQRLAEAVAEAERRAALPWAQEAFRLSLRGLVGSYLARGSASLWSAAATVRAPTLLVWGTEDRLVSVALAPRALAAFGHSRLLVLPNVGHVAQLEEPETVARAVLALLEDLAAEPGASAVS